ncbi:MAG: ribulose-phosphate 3-epimerase [Candidatus Sumerlaeaceae bacterium]|nr:ribulose-phosphate 3-epimerase [Candidatus Sumerlaeaceae bacterium]
MPGSVLIVPSLLSADFSQLATELRRVERAGCTWIHLDIMDNHFVPNLTFGPPVVASLRKVTNKLFFDTHLMVTDPGSLIEPFAQAGAQLLTVHAEAARKQLPDLLKSIRAHGMKAGVSIKPATPVSAIEEILPQTDLVLVMTVEPGFGGQTLMPACLNKIRTLKKLRSVKRGRFLIEVDGGINVSTIELAVAAGAELLVAGSAVFSGGSVSRNVAALRQAAGV